ncbi:MAG TPA: patatin-like phospholipase family protein [Longimicrobiales bacterium]|nr:patatin-like phospholipase family protein [Longimicrobiales bacterium]
MQHLEPLEARPTASLSPGPTDLGIVMTGGGARAAYQVGFLRCVARRFPNLSVPYVTGVSAGAINAALLASHHGTFLQAVHELSELWGNLTAQEVFRTDTRSLAMNAINWLRQLASGGMGVARYGSASPKLVRGLVDTQPLRDYLTEVLHCVDGELTGIQYNLDAGRLRALAISATSYSTGRSVTWIQGQGVELWRRPQRRPRLATINVEHVMASAALPLFFPAVQVENAWYGDGGVRLIAPLSPAVRLGARHIIAISTRHVVGDDQDEIPVVQGYPPPAQVAGVILNSIFLDLLDHDAVRLQRLNQLIEDLPVEKRRDLKEVKLLTLRPSADLGRMAGQFEAQLPRAFRFLTRGLGTRQTRSPDFLSLIMFQPDYLRALIEMGERDAEVRAEEIDAFLGDTD